MTHIWEIKDKNKLVFAIDREYKSLFISICKKQIENFIGLPIVWEDIYYEFLSEVPNYAKEYKPGENVPFLNFMVIKCKFFAKNMCKRYTLKNHKIMNSYVAWDDVKYGAVHDKSYIDEKRFDLGDLTNSENRYFKYHFLQGLSNEETRIKMGISRYRCDKIHDSIIRKAKSKFKI